MTIIHKVNSEELVKLLEYSDMPVIVNMPESLLWAIPLYVRDRSKFVTCGESVCGYATPELMLQGYYDGHVDRDTVLRTFDEASVCHVVCDVTGMISLGGE